LTETASRARLQRALPWLVLAAAIAVISLDGRIDLWVSELFYQPGLGFIGRSDDTIMLLRGSTRISAIAVGLWLAFALVYRTLLGRPLFGLSRAGVIYLLAVFLLVPGLAVNGVLKEHWGRARPLQVEQFGGTRHFTLAILPTDQCTHNCSFVSGEASLGFAFVAFGFAARSPARRRLGFALGGILGAAFGLIRIAQGGHFLSDVAYAGLVTVLLAWLLHWLLIDSGLLDRAGARLAPYFPGTRTGG
jgi:lipid A 4'-phosphatase